MIKKSRSAAPKARKKAALPQVLLIESNPKEAELYAELIRESIKCELDVMNRVSKNLDWLAKSSHQLIVVDLVSFKGKDSGKDSSADGLTILQKIKSVNPETAVILISEYASIEQAVSSIRLGAEDFFKKPFNFESFKLAIRRALDRRTVMGEGVGAAEYLNLLVSCQMISATLDVNRILQVIRSYFSAELEIKHSSFYTLDAALPVAGEEGEMDSAMEEILDIALSTAKPFAKMIEADEVYRFVERGKLTPGLFVFRFQLGAGAERFFVGLSPKKPDSPGSEDKLMALEGRLKMLRRQIEVTGRNIVEFEGMQNLAFVDDATGLYNTRYLNYILDREIAKSQQSKKSFAVLFIDADYFKRVNDEHGHLIGTKLLNELGAHFKNQIRERDSVFRYGGDEFVGVLAPCDRETARVVAERIRQSVEERVFLAAEGLELKLTVSIGVALYPDHADSKSAVIDLADQAMYMAKKRSRNTVYLVDSQKGSEIDQKK